MGFSLRRGFRCLFGRARRLSGKTRCSVCLKYYKLTALRTLPHCTHTYCRTCLRRTFSRLVSEPECMIPPRCCGAEITLKLAGNFLDGCDDDDLHNNSGSSNDGDTAPVGGLRERYIEILEKRTHDAVFCARGCVRAPRKSDEGLEGGGERGVFILPEDIKEEEDLAMCSACGKGTCTLCRRPGPHTGEGGDAACGVQGEEAKQDIRYTRLSGRNGWRSCEACGMMVSRDVGCSHVVCRCGNDVWLAF